MICFITILAFEMVYRFSIIDFYKAELKVLNSEEELLEKNIDYLVFGDSFSAWGNSFVNVLKERNPNKSFINSGISGIGLKELNTFAKRRIKAFNPKTIIYQVYVGNDLVDVKHLSNWNELSTSRNLYWKITDYVKSGIYINMKLKGFRRDIKSIDVNTSHKFSPEAYSQREKMMLKADKNYLDHSINLIFKQRYDIWKDDLQDFLNIIPKSTQVYVVFIPHCSQLNDFYYNNMLKIDAKYESKEAVFKTNYTFFDTAKNDFKDLSNVSFLNPLQYLRENDSLENRVYYEIDPHLTTYGQVVLADYLTKSNIVR